MVRGRRQEVEASEAKRWELINRKVKRYLTINLSVFCHLLAGKKVGGGLRTFRNISIFFFFILFTPSLLTFLNSLRKDPAVPQLVTATKEWFKKRSFSFLGGRTSSPNGDHTYDNPNRFSVEEKYS
mmetsp:Transcript_23693/g.53470  ORF Transcript_23693/g.53470 Transcript_23693/m.53470 type:complete len:126 (-) Transcript_23693:351-728(-)